MSEYVTVASSGPSAAFFDLDRTLISGSSAFTLATAGAQGRLIPTPEFVRDAVGAVAFKLFGADDDTTDAVKARILGGRPGSARATCRRSTTRSSPDCSARSGPKPDGCSIHRHAGRDTYIVSAAPQEIVEPLAHSLGMTGGHRHTRRGRRRRVHRRARRTVLLRAPARSKRCSELARLERLRPRPVLRVQRLGERSADARSRRPPRRRQPRRQARTPRPPHGWPIVIFSQRTKTVDPPHRRVGRHRRRRRRRLRRRHRRPASQLATSPRRCRS